jgi:S-adenosyl-L-methionine hydrolase (adenosine-forming)
MATGKGGGRKAKGQAATSPRRTVSISKKKRGSSEPSLITLLTDFGITDHFVAAMKGVILSVNPFAKIVDITHQIPPQEIQVAAFTILAAYDSFPKGTINVVVVDPGVGSSRLPIAVQAAGQFFLGPDNGIFTHICERHTSVVRAINNEDLFRHPVSSTFHGRDIFAPVAAALASGVKFAAIGPVIDDWVRLDTLAIKRRWKREREGRILHIDHFGNCITSFTKKDLKEGTFVLIVNKNKIGSFRQFFADEHNHPDEVFAYWGSVGFLELGVRNSSAAKLLRTRVGDLVLARLKND